jgi:hypothetical protein
MVTMIDEIYDRQYQAGRQQLNASVVDGITNFGRAVLNAFTVLNRIEYQSPWTAQSRRARSH